MSRYSTPIIYTFEFLVVIFLFLITALFYIKKIDKGSLIIYLITGIFHTIMELIAEGTGVRIIKDAYIFSFKISYPFLPIILGFFEGGMICLGAYHFTRIIANKDKFSLKFFSILYAILFTLILIGSIQMKIQLESGQSELTLTRRELFTSTSIILLAIFYTIAILYFILKQDLNNKERLSLIYYFIGVALFTSVMNIPTHIAGVRFIEIEKNGVFIKASFLEQLFVLYVLDLILESGFYIQYYPIIFHFKIIEIKDKVV